MTTSEVGSHTHTHTHTGARESYIRARGRERGGRRERVVHQGNGTEEKEFKKRNIFKGRTDGGRIEWRTETGSWFQITGVNGQRAVIRSPGGLKHECVQAQGYGVKIDQTMI